MIGSISAGSARTAEIIKSLRTFSRLDEGEEKLADIHENIESTLVMLRNEYKDVITIRKEFGNVPQIVCNPGKLNQVFMNILSNAIQAIKGKEFISPEEEIVIKTQVINEKPINYVEIEIRDTGPGIPENIRDRIFEPFFYYERRWKKVPVLGLSISLSIIESHKGKIEVDTSPPYGASFKIYLPLEREGIDHE